MPQTHVLSCGGVAPPSADGAVADVHPKKRRKMTGSPGPTAKPKSKPPAEPVTPKRAARAKAQSKRPAKPVLSDLDESNVKHHSDATASDAASNNGEHAEPAVQASG